MCLKYIFAIYTSSENACLPCVHTMRHGIQSIVNFSAVYMLVHDKHEFLLFSSSVNID